MTTSLHWFIVSVALHYKKQQVYFFDDNALDKDDFGEYDEHRTLTIGMSNQARLLIVVWTQREDTIRIITAFFPNKHQQREYTNARF